MTADHSADADCTVAPDTNCCTGCGADHSAACPSCGGAGFHAPGCSASPASGGPGWGKEQRDGFYDAYVTAALWSSTDNADPSGGGEPLDSNYDWDDIDPVSRREMREDCDDFVTRHNDLLAEAAARPEYTRGARGQWPAEELAGHDFWLTRNGHGAGFRDRGLGGLGERLAEAAESYGECDMFVHDGTITADGTVAHRRRAAADLPPSTAAADAPGL